MQQNPQGLNRAAQIKIEMSRLRKELNQLEPGNRSVRADPALNTLLELKRANKDVVSVGWANSKKSADVQFAKYPKQYEGWEAKEDEDIDGDNINDTIIYNKSGNPKIINGQTIKKSGHPYRQAVYTAYPTREERKAENEKIKAGEEIPFKKQYNRLKVVHTKDGQVRVEYNVNKQRKEGPSSYKLFGQVFFAPIWDSVKFVFADLDTKQKLKVYGDMLRSLWRLIQTAAFQELGIDASQLSQEAFKSLSSKKQFKNTVDAIVRGIIGDPQTFAMPTIKELVNYEPELLKPLEDNMPRIIASMRELHEFQE